MTLAQQVTAGLALCLFAACAGSGGGSETGATADSAARNPSLVVRVSVLRDGRVLADGRPVTLQALDQVFTELEAARGGVWYFREGPGAGAPEDTQRRSVTAVLDLVLRHRLPVSLSSKADFSDYVDTSGVSRPRRVR